MWQCPQCGELVEKPFKICWQCGTAPDGTVNPYFYRPGPAEPGQAESEPEPDRTPFQYSLRSLFIFVTLCSILMAAWRCFGLPVIVFVAVIILGNLFSAAVGVVVTLILPKPDDSGNYP